MSIAGIASSILSQLGSPQKPQQSQIATEFQQLAQDLQSGNLTQAQTDFATLQQNAPAAQAGSTNLLSQAFSALGTDLKSGNLTGAQQDFATIQQDVSANQQTAQGGQVHHHHHHHVGASQDAANSTQQTNSITQLFATLGQDLQNGNLSSAQQAYGSLQQDLQLFSASGFGASSLSSPTAIGTLSLSA